MNFLHYSDVAWHHRSPTDDALFYGVLSPTTQKLSKPPISGLCTRNPPVIGGLSTQRPAMQTVLHFITSACAYLQGWGHIGTVHTLTLGQQHRHIRVMVNSPFWRYTAYITAVSNIRKHIHIIFLSLLYIHNIYIYILELYDLFRCLCFFIPNKATFTRYYLTQWISKLPGSTWYISRVWRA